MKNRLTKCAVCLALAFAALPSLAFAASPPEHTPCEQGRERHDSLTYCSIATPFGKYGGVADAAMRWMPVPRQDGKQTRVTSYIVRVRYTGGDAPGSTALIMRAAVADQGAGQLRREFTDRQSVADDGSSTFHAHIEVPSHTPVSHLGMAFEALGDDPLVIRDISVTEMTRPDHDIDF